MSVLIVSLRRSLWLLLVATAGGAAYSWWRDRSLPEPAAPPEWPPLQPEPVAAVPVEAVPAVELPEWVEPLDGGGCPLSHPIKANDNSGIFHVPGGRFYDRTKAERCYSTAAAATADGYRQAKN
ncbi:MAG: hypothetical protein ACE37B_17035 [Ilumatobacter sp.]|jgi:hypothetical protein|uniref:sunset domain-containing protein n=1 Tax=Ilumatobacter sp. TaxID=1967498 RepID=UPI00391CBCEF